MIKTRVISKGFSSDRRLLKNDRKMSQEESFKITAKYFQELTQRTEELERQLAERDAKIAELVQENLELRFAEVQPGESLLATAVRKLRLQVETNTARIQNLEKEGVPEEKKDEEPKRNDVLVVDEEAFLKEREMHYRAWKNAQRYIQIQKATYGVCSLCNVMLGRSVEKANTSREKFEEILKMWDLN